MLDQCQFDIRKPPVQTATTWQLAANLSGYGFSKPNGLGPVTFTVFMRFTISFAQNFTKRPVFFQISRGPIFVEKNFSIFEDFPVNHPLKQIGSLLDCKKPFPLKILSFIPRLI